MKKVSAVFTGTSRKIVAEESRPKKRLKTKAHTAVQQPVKLETASHSGHTGHISIIVPSATQQKQHAKQATNTPKRKLIPLRTNATQRPKTSLIISRKPPSSTSDAVHISNDVAHLTTVVQSVHIPRADGHTSFVKQAIIYHSTQFNHSSGTFCN